MNEKVLKIILNVLKYAIAAACGYFGADVV